MAAPIKAVRPFRLPSSISALQVADHPLITKWRSTWHRAGDISHHHTRRSLPTSELSNRTPAQSAIGEGGSSERRRNSRTLTGSTMLTSVSRHCNACKILSLSPCRRIQPYSSAGREKSRRDRARSLSQGDRCLDCHVRSAAIGNGKRDGRGACGIGRMFMIFVTSTIEAISHRQKLNLKELRISGSPKCCQTS